MPMGDQFLGTTLPPFVSAAATLQQRRGDVAWQSPHQKFARAPQHAAMGSAVLAAKA